MDRKAQVTGKKVYQQPQLKVYGDVLKLTGASMVAGTITDGMFGTLKSA